MLLVCICGSVATNRCRHCKSNGCCDAHKSKFVCVECKPIEAGYYKDGIVYEQAYYKPNMITHPRGFGRHWSKDLDKVTDYDKAWQDRVQNNVMSAEHSYVIISKNDIDGYTYTSDVIKRILVDDEATGEVRPADSLFYGDIKFPLNRAPLAMIVKQLREEYFYVIFLTVNRRDASLRSLEDGATDYDAVLTLRVTDKKSSKISGKMYAVSPTLVLVGKASETYRDLQPTILPTRSGLRISPSYLRRLSSERSTRARWQHSRLGKVPKKPHERKGEEKKMNRIFSFVL